ncbi:MAG: MarR [Cyanobacteria bacterium RYN_339]|nr:MarR [Cyanobacteria bacterium RYN_339]
MAVDRCLCFNLGLAHRKVARAFEEALAPLGLTMAQAHFLSCLFQQDAMRPVDLSRSLGVDAGTLTPMIDRLERLHLIRRCPDPEDRRAARICLEDAAWRIKPELEDRLKGATERLMGKFSPDEYASLLHLVQRLAGEEPDATKVAAAAAAGGGTP